MATLQYVVNAIDGASGVFAKIALSAEDVNKQIDELGKKSVAARARLDGGDQMNTTLDKLDLKLIRLKNRVIDPDVSDKGLLSMLLTAKAVNLELDAINGKKVQPDVSSGALSRLAFRFLGGRSSGGGSGLAGILPTIFGLGGGGGGAAAAGAPAAGGGIAALGGTGIAAGATAGLAALAAGAGGIVPLLAAATLGLGSFAALAIPTIRNLQTGLSALSTATDNYQAASANLNIAIHKSPADMLAYKATIHGLEPDLQNAAKLLTNQNVVWQNLSPSMQHSVVALYNNSAAYKALLPSQKTALTALLAQKTAWDQLTPGQQAASTAIHGLSAAFGHLADKLAPITLKVLNDGLGILKNLLPSLLPLATAAGNAIDTLLKGIEKFITPAGAGDKLHGKLAAITSLPPQATGFQQFISQMTQQAGPAIAAIGEGIGKIVVAVGKLLIALSNPNGLRILKGIFDLIAAVITGVAAVVTYATHRVISNIHGISIAFDDVRRFFAVAGHDIMVIWDTLWRNTVTRVANGVGDVERWFNSLPGGIKKALSGLGQMLLGLATGSMNDFWNGIKSVGGQILSWLGGFVKSIVSTIGKLLHMSPPHPGSVFFDLGASMMQHLAAGIKAHASSAANAVKSAAMAVAQGAMGGPATGGAGAAQAYARSRLGAFGWGPSQMGPLIALWNQESGWNRLARNPTSGAYGIPQALPPGKMGAAANPPLSSMAAQINWGLSYIKSRYGSPSAAEAHELAFRWYGSGLTGGIFSRPTLIGVGESGPERVDITPAGTGSNTDALLKQLIAEVRALAPRTGAAVSAGVNGGTRAAARAAYYATRPR